MAGESMGRVAAASVSSTVSPPPRGRTSATNRAAASRGRGGGDQPAQPPGGSSPPDAPKAAATPALGLKPFDPRPQSQRSARLLHGPADRCYGHALPLEGGRQLRLRREACLDRRPAGRIEPPVREGGEVGLLLRGKPGLFLTLGHGPTNKGNAMRATFIPGAGATRGRRCDATSCHRARTAGGVPGLRRVRRVQAWRQRPSHPASGGGHRPWGPRPAAADRRRAGSRSTGCLRRRGRRRWMSACGPPRPRSS